MRHVIFEAYRKASLWKRIKCGMHVWEDFIDKELGWDDDYMLSLRVDQCVECKTQRLWILREHKIERTRKDAIRSSKENPKEGRIMKCNECGKFMGRVGSWDEFPLGPHVNTEYKCVCGNTQIISDDYRLKAHGSEEKAAQND